MSLMEMKTTYYRGPLDNPSCGQPWHCGPYIAPCQQKAITEQTSSSLFLTAVRVTIERGDWKMDCRGSQKVISGQEDTSPSQETSVCTWEKCLPSGNVKKATKPNPQPDPQPRISRSLCIPCHAVFLFSTNKIFLTSAAGVHLCFHPQSGLKNPEQMKFLRVSSVHQIDWMHGSSSRGPTLQVWSPEFKPQFH
jgi:hypothetical protein